MDKQISLEGASTNLDVIFNVFEVLLYSLKGRQKYTCICVEVFDNVTNFICTYRFGGARACFWLGNSCDRRKFVAFKKHNTYVRIFLKTTVSLSHTYIPTLLTDFLTLDYM